MSRNAITTGAISARASWRTFFSKDWKPSVWLLEGRSEITGSSDPPRLLVFRRSDDMATWLNCAAQLAVRARE